MKLGKYELHEQLGKGGFGTVFRATDNIGRTVAIKILKPGFADDPDVIERFRREALAAGSLFHSHIATILDFDEADGRVFIVMRYIDGKSLDQILKERGRIPWGEAVGIIRQIANALDFAHSKGFIHRDIKPGNIIISPSDGAVLTDFGLVKAATASGLSTTGVMLGTPAYIAPEIWEGKGATAATDIYSLACVFYEMLTAQVLFNGESTPMIMKKHFDEITLPANWPEGVPDHFDTVITNALERKSQERFQNMKSFVDALTQLEASDSNQDEPAVTTAALPTIEKQEVEIVEEKENAEQWIDSENESIVEQKDSNAEIFDSAEQTETAGEIISDTVIPVPPPANPPFPLQRSNVVGKQKSRPWYLIFLVLIPVIIIVIVSSNNANKNTNTIAANTNGVYQNNSVSADTPHLLPTATTGQYYSPTTSSYAQTKSACDSRLICKEIEVKATRLWQSYDITVEKGQHIRLTYISGTWSAWGGSIASVPYEQSTGGFFLTNEGVNSLVWVVGKDSLPKALKSSSDENIADQSGVLYFRMNDSDMTDNSGSVTMLVEVW